MLVLVDCCFVTVGWCTAPIEAQVGTHLAWSFRANDCTKGDDMEQIRLKNFRCFREAQTARLAPLTLLVGENSTGKTSFIALIRALWDVAHRRAVPGFKEAPYDLGSFDEIVHYRKGKAGQAPSFEAGFDSPFPVGVRGQEQQGDAGERLHRFDVTFIRRGTVPIPATWRLSCDDLRVEEHLQADSSRLIFFRTANGEWQRKVPGSVDSSLPSDFRVLTSFSHLAASLPGEDKEPQPLPGSPSMTDQDKQKLDQLVFEFGLGGFLLTVPRPFASAPVRSKPRRTYDPSQPGREPEGENVPMYLSTTFFEKRKSWEALKKALEAFGHDAGLFDEITVRPLGKRGSEPFQMQVRKHGRRAKGPMRNLIDVGYGVSQVLPVVTELFRDTETPMFLLQQPEVHLHPSAQAALGSLFCRIAARERQLVIETHSDHLIDRVRMDVRDGTTKLTPDDVSILFFERRDLDARIHSLRLDQEGNVLGAPPNYRGFFMNETRRGLGL